VHVPTSYIVLLFRGEAFWLARQYDEARKNLEESLEVMVRCGARLHGGWAHRLLGEIALKTSPDEAPAHFEKAISIASEIKAENELALAYSGMGRYHKHQGNTEQARQYLTDALEIFERLGTLIEPDKVREELAGLPK
jgi:tetratricopeptide (TPR) repeat protein